MRGGLGLGLGLDSEVRIGGRTDGEGDGEGWAETEKDGRMRERERERERARVTGAMRRGGRSGSVGELLRRGTVLFVFGVCYGALVGQLHDNKELYIAPVEVKGINSAGWAYLVFWGLAGVGMGCALPWVDSLWERGGQEEEVDDGLDEGRGDRKRGLGGVEWSDVVRGVGAFVGVAFAIVSLLPLFHFLPITLPCSV